jgi:hypothetical protein
VEIIVRTLLGLLLIAHGLVHLLWFATSDDPAWPFRLDRSRLVPGAARTPTAVALIALVVVGFALLGLAVWGVPGLTSTWPVLAIAASLASLATMVLFGDRRLLWGVAIDVALIVGALWQPTWTDRFG